MIAARESAVMAMVDQLSASTSALMSAVTSATIDSQMGGIMAATAAAMSVGASANIAAAMGAALASGQAGLAALNYSAAQGAARLGASVTVGQSVAIGWFDEAAASAVAPNSGGSSIVSPSQSQQAGGNVYIINRQLGGGPARSIYNPVTHTYVFTTNSDGTIRNTYSWGNTANTHGWNANQPEDIRVAQQGLQNGAARTMGDSSLIPFVDQAYTTWSGNKDMEHINLILTFNCKTEASELIDYARRLSGRNPPSGLGDLPPLGP